VGVVSSSETRSKNLSGTSRINLLNQLSMFDSSTSSSSLAVLNEPIRFAARMIAGLSGEEISFDFFENVPGGMRVVDFASDVGVPDSNLE